jgi:isoleucyl-tRNA synthetase
LRRDSLPQRDRHSRRLVRLRHKLVRRLRIRSRPEGAYTAFKTARRPECLYLEGGDQHRGWFHSSLLTSVALRGRAPYSHVATAGWTLDEQGRAMSKSLGNGVDPVDIANRMGGEIVRLWVASVDFREDMAASENLMQRCADIYRKLRNTFRFLLGNLHGFDPAAIASPKPSCCRSTATCWPARAS